MRHPPTEVRFVGSFVDQLPDVELPEVAFAGRSNVGKSSAINAILGRKAIAKVSGTPGRTQLINLFELDGRLVFADLPGYGFAKVPEDVRRRWKGMVEGYLARRETLRLVVVLVDARREPQALDGDLISGLVKAGIPLIVVATKVDKLNRNERSKQIAAIRKGFSLGDGQLVPFSAITREGVDEVWRILSEVAG